MRLRISPPVLVVEDNAVNQLAMGALLSRLGFSYAMASGGRDAIKLFREVAPSVVLMDLMMPDLNGFETAQVLRTMEFGTGRRTPIVAITSHDPELVRCQCIEAGIDDVQGKPVEEQTLAAKLRLWAAEPAVPPTHDTRPSTVPPKSGIQTAASALAKCGLQDVHGSENLLRLVATFLTVTETMLTELDAAIHTHDDDLIRKTLQELEGATLRVRREIVHLCLEVA